MTHPKVALNGIDPNGEHPPDEMVYNGDDCRYELVHIGADYGEWELRVYKPSGAHHKHFYGDFADAFGQFTAKVSDAQAVTA